MSGGGGIPNLLLRNNVGHALDTVLGHPQSLWFRTSIYLYSKCIRCSVRRLSRRSRLSECMYTCTHLSLGVRFCIPGRRRRLDGGSLDGVGVAGLDGPHVGRPRHHGPLVLVPPELVGALVVEAHVERLPVRPAAASAHRLPGEELQQVVPPGDRYSIQFNHLINSLIN